ncbi:hypothetical protein SB783_45215, partial [Paraburkholderia sp. SIMBA_009]
LVVLDEFYAPVRLNLDLALFDGIKAGRLPISEESRKEIGKELFPERPAEAEREELLDELDAQSNMSGFKNPEEYHKRATGNVPDFV